MPYYFYTRINFILLIVDIKKVGAVEPKFSTTAPTFSEHSYFIYFTGSLYVTPFVSTVIDLILISFLGL